MTSAREVVLERLRTGSQPGQRDDPHRVVLAVEGGGMRGVVSAGMLLAFEQLGMTACVDVVVGTSAGAVSGAFFVAGRAVEGSVLFYTELTSEPFLDRSRLLKREAALNLHHLIDEAAVSRGLDFDQVAASPIPLYATVTPVDPTNPRREFHVTGPGERVAAILKATASLPVLGGAAKRVDEAEYCDGGLWEQVPWRTAASLGATHVLVLPSQPVRADAPLDTLSFIERVSVVPVVRRIHGDHIGRLVADLPARSSHQAWNLRAVADGRASALDHSLAEWPGVLEIVELADDVDLPARLETSRPVLVDALAAGASAVLAHFGLDEVVVEQRVVLTHPKVPVKQVRSSMLAELAGQLTDIGQPLPPAL